MPKVQELNAKQRPRKPDNFQVITDEQWRRLQGTKPLRWRLVSEKITELKSELKIETLNTKKKKHD